MLSPLDAACDSQQTRNTICLTAMKHGRGHWLSTLYQTHRNVTKCQACYIERYYTPFQTSILQPRQRYGHMVLIANSYGLLRTVKQPWANTPPPSNRNPSLHIREKTNNMHHFLGIMNTPSHTDLILFSATSDHVCLLQFDIEADPNLWNSEHLLDEKLASGFDSPCRNKRSFRTVDLKNSHLLSNILVLPYIVSIYIYTYNM